MIYFPLFYFNKTIYSANALCMHIVSSIVINEEFVKKCFVIVCYHGFRLQVTVTDIWLNWYILPINLSILDNRVFFYTIRKHACSSKDCI